MDIEKLKYEAQNKALHIADVSGSALFNADCMDILPLIPDKSVQLIVIDPPYFEIKGDFDFVFESEKQYLEFIEGVIIESKRVLKQDGSLFCIAVKKWVLILI